MGGRAPAPAQGGDLSEGRTFHPAAWLAWFAVSLYVVNSASNPFGLAVVMCALAVVAAAFAGRRSGPGGFGLFLRLGLIFIAVRVVLFALTGHTGETTLLTLPEARLPAWLGGLALGGPVTAEVLASSVAEGLKMAAFLAAFGALLSAVDVYRLLRLLPRSLAEAGLVVTIGLAFVPTILRAATDARDALRLRGHRFRGLRSAIPLVGPVLSNALERSVVLAESMEMRGYGRRAPPGGPAAEVEGRLRAAALACTLALAAGAAAATLGLGPAPVRWGLPAAAAAGLAASAASLSRIVPRTRYRAEGLGPWDAAMVSLAAGVGALAAVASGAAWTAYPAVSWPSLDAGVILTPMLLVFPAVLDGMRGRRLARASARAAPDPRHRIEVTA